jgi:tetratricopeptide (TPR) repeat protein
VTGQILTLDESLQDTIPAVLSLLDALPEETLFAKLDPPQRRQRTLDGLKRILLRESQVQPLVLVFEDLHWHDNESQALLDSLAESLPTAQLLLLVNYRPEYTHNWGSKTYYTQLRLDPLLPESADALLDALLGNNASLESLKKLLIERTQGVPFFLEESVRTLVETGTLVGESGAYHLVQDLPSIQVPPTVQAVLAARIDRLPQEEKQLLQIASVIGNEVPFTLLQTIAEIPDGALHPSLTHLQATEFLYETSLFPERIYTFKHALTHEVAYGSLLQERRRVLHTRIVDALEAFGSERVVEQVERLAHHAMRGEVWDKALVYCRQAGEKARMQSGRREAMGYFEQALSALQHLPKQRDTIEQAIELRLTMRTVLRELGGLERVLALLHEAEVLAEALDNPRRLGQVSLYFIVHFAFKGAYDQAIAAAQRTFALATTSGDVALDAMANLFLGVTYQAQGDYRRAIDCLEQPVAFFDRARRRERFVGQSSPQSVVSRAYLATCHAELGTFTQGRIVGDEGLQVAEADAYLGSLRWALWGLGLLCLRQGDLPRAIPLLERAVSICQEANLLGEFSVTVWPLGAAYTLGGRVAAAVPLLTQALEQAAVIESERVDQQALCHLSLGEAKMLAGCPEEALALAEGALALTREHQERGNQAYALRLLGDVAARRAPPENDQAETHYRQALTLATELGMRPLQAHCHRGLGTLYRQTGQAEQARAELSMAIEMYRDMEMTFWLPETEAALAAVEGKA